MVRTTRVNGSYIEYKNHLTPFSYLDACTRSRTDSTLVLGVTCNNAVNRRHKHSHRCQLQEHGPEINETIHVVFTGSGEKIEFFQQLPYILLPE